MCSASSTPWRVKTPGTARRCCATWVWTSPCWRCTSTTSVKRLRPCWRGFHDPRLRPQHLHRQRDAEFQDLAQRASPWPKRQVLRHLLRDRAGTSQCILALAIGLAECRSHLAHVDAEMAAELIVLGQDDRPHKVARHARQRHPAIVDLLPVEALGEHQRRSRRIDEPQHQQTETDHCSCRQCRRQQDARTAHHGEMGTRQQLGSQSGRSRQTPVVHLADAPTSMT